ncbi:hypothetical protein STEG23_007258 [Scotinomys teguina]
MPTEASAGLPGTRTAALRTKSRMCRLSWFLDPGGWSKTAVVGLYFIFPGICTLSLDLSLNLKHTQLGDWLSASCLRSYSRLFTVYDRKWQNKSHVIFTTSLTGLRVHMETLSAIPVRMFPERFGGGGKIHRKV